MQARVKALVKSGQLNFLNGGWAMHDEAGTHYVNMIEQTQRGHEFLMDAFAYAPTIGWQVRAAAARAHACVCVCITS